jgi:hypothetical protein
MHQDDRGRSHGQTPLGRHPPLVRQQDRQRIDRGHHSLVQAAKAKNRGYHSTRNLKPMVGLLAGKLDLRLPA